MIECPNLALWSEVPDSDPRRDLCPVYSITWGLSDRHSEMLPTRAEGFWGES